MGKFDAKSSRPVDVMILGDHPASFLAAALLAGDGRRRVVHAPLPDHLPADRLVVINHAVFDSDPVLETVRHSIPMSAIRGLVFLSDSAGVRSEYRSKSAAVSVARYRDVRRAFQEAADAAGVELCTGKPVDIGPVDEAGVDLTIGRHHIRATALVVAGELSQAQRSVLNVAGPWGADVVHRFTAVRCKADKHLLMDGKASSPMSLDLGGELRWGRLLAGDGEFMLSVDEPVERATADGGVRLLGFWIDILKLHGFLDVKFHPSPSSIRSFDLPLAGALAREAVGNRTLLVGPAGGFVSECGEEIYPGCWSAVFAAAALDKALDATHLQDALDPFRHSWRVTLGEYMRGPRDNLRFLLPLVYKNPAMTARLAEAILFSKNVVR